jgi:trehalose 6-phosphate phosphatase
MTLLFSEQGRERLAAIAKPGVLCAFDFDGTLAPIVAQPDRAYLPLDLRERLVELSKYAPVAIITGRSLQDIRVRAGFDADFIIGNHGLEGLPGWEKRASRYEGVSRGWLERLTAELQQRESLHPGIWIENKRYSLSVHYRLAADQERAETELLTVFKGLSPQPRIISGKYVYNLMPEEAVHKGSALEQLIGATGATGAIYVGDDVTDEDVFRLRRSDLLSVRIEAAANSAAEFFVPRRQDIAQLLDELILRLREAHANNWTQPAATHSA